VRIKDRRWLRRRAFETLHLRPLPPRQGDDLVDEAAAKLRTEIDSMPVELDEASRRIMQLEIEREALKKESDQGSKLRLQRIEEELANLKAETDAIKARCKPKGRVQKLARCASNRGDQDRDRAKPTPVRSQRAESCATENCRLEKELKRRAELIADASRACSKKKSTRRTSRGRRRWTGDRFRRYSKARWRKLLRLDDELHKRVIGQDEAVTAGRGSSYSRVLGFRNRIARSLRHLPRPTGVGKTELARALAGIFRRRARDGAHRHVGVRREALVARLIGRLPVTSATKRRSTDRSVRRRPFSVVLFDEIEKAAPDVFNVCPADTRRWALDDVRAAPSTSEHESCDDLEHGSQRILDYRGAARPNTRDASDLLDELRQHFRRSFQSRQRSFVFRALTRSSSSRSSGFNSIGYGSVSRIPDHARTLAVGVRHLVRVRLHPVYGARPLKARIQKELETPLGRRILGGEVREVKRARRLRSGQR